MLNAANQYSTNSIRPQPTSISKIKAPNLVQLTHGALVFAERKLEEIGDRTNETFTGVLRNFSTGICRLTRVVAGESCVGEARFLLSDIHEKPSGNLKAHGSVAQSNRHYASLHVS